MNPVSSSPPVKRMLINVVIFVQLVLIIWTTDAQPFESFVDKVGSDHVIQSKVTVVSGHWVLSSKHPLSFYKKWYDLY
jgi:hypothetical protein